MTSHREILNQHEAGSAALPSIRLDFHTGSMVERLTGVLEDEGVALDSVYISVIGSDQYRAILAHGTHRWQLPHELSGADRLDRDVIRSFTHRHPHINPEEIGPADIVYTIDFDEELLGRVRGYESLIRYKEVERVMNGDGRTTQQLIPNEASIQADWETRIGAALMKARSQQGEALIVLYDRDSMQDMKNKGAKRFKGRHYENAVREIVFVNGILEIPRPLRQKN